MGPPPVVSGISPREGPPGTKITIRGENFGTSPQVSCDWSAAGYTTNTHL